MTRIVDGYPPVYDAIVAAIGRPPATAVFTYGDAIYVPGGRALPADVMEHERVHVAQQRDAGGPEAWWDRYLADPTFRAEQEMAAYRRQYEVYCGGQRDRNARVRFRAAIAGHLAGPMYGRVIEFLAAYAGVAPR